MFGIRFGARARPFAALHARPFAALRARPFAALHVQAARAPSLLAVLPPARREPSALARACAGALALATPRRAAGAAALLAAGALVGPEVAHAAAARERGAPAIPARLSARDEQKARADAERDAIDPDAEPPPLNADDSEAAAAAAAAAEASSAELVSSSRVWWLVLAEMSEDGYLFFAAMLASVVAAIAGVRAAQHIGGIFDIMADGVHPGASAALGPAVASLLFVYALRAALTFLSATLLSMAVNRLSARLQTRLVGSLLEQDIAFFDGAAAGALAQAVAADVKEASAALKHLLQNGLQMLTVVVGGAVSLLSLSRTLSAVMMTAIPLTTLVFRQFGNYIRTLSRRERAATAGASAIVVESVGNIRTVQSFVAEGLEAARFEADVRSALALRHSLGMLRGAFFGLLSFALHGVTAVVVFVGGSLVSRGAMTHGDVSAFLAQTREVIQAFGGLTRLADEARDGAGAMRRVVELIEQQPQLLARGAAATRGLAPAGPPAGRIEFQNVHFAYPRRADVPVLAGLNLTLEAGKVTALVGDSGSGKSTVAWLLERFYDPDATAGGAVLLDGVPLPDYDVRWLRRQIGLVSQEPVLFATTIGKNILYGRPDATQAEVRDAALRANAHGFVAAFPEGYGKRLGAGGAGLSGGQKQRVAIARALLKRPAILILDEATSALDAKSERVVLDALDAGLLEGRTTLVIAHRLSTVKRADKIAVLKDGRVVEQGTHAELIARDGVYASLVKLQLSSADS